MFPGKGVAEPKIREGVPFRYRPSPKRLDCANLLARIKNVAGRAQFQHNTIMHAHVAMVWGPGRQWPVEPGKSNPQHKEWIQVSIKLIAKLVAGPPQNRERNATY